MIRRPPRSTRKESSAASDVYKRQMSTGGAKQSKGLYAGHAYSLLKAIELNTRNMGAVRLIQIRNPWGEYEWTGDWSDACGNWTNELRMQAGHVKKDDGTFFMSIDDFYNLYSYTFVCQVVDSYIRTDVTMNEYEACVIFQLSTETKGFFSAHQMTPRMTKAKSCKPLFIELYAFRDQKLQLVKTKAPEIKALDFTQNPGGCNAVGIATIEAILPPGLYIMHGFFLNNDVPTIKYLCFSAYASKAVDLIHLKGKNSLKSITKNDLNNALQNYIKTTNINPPEKQPAIGTIYTCPESHQVKFNQDKTAAFRCDVCKDYRSGGRYQCEGCGYDVCTTCRTAPPGTAAPKKEPEKKPAEPIAKPTTPVAKYEPTTTIKTSCSKNHSLELKMINFMKDRLFICGVCSDVVRFSGPRWVCEKCSYYLCEKCRMPTSTVGTSGTSGTKVTTSTSNITGGSGSYSSSYKYTETIKTTVISTPRCTRSHNLDFNYDLYPENAYLCDRCNREGKCTSGRWRCLKCNYDICTICTPRSTASTQRYVSVYEYAAPISSRVISTCLLNHMLWFSKYKYLSNAYQCNKCFNEFPCDEGRWFCVECEYDICPTCRPPPADVEKHEKTCFNGHSMIVSKNRYTSDETVYRCRFCGKAKSVDNTRWWCPICGFDLCTECADLDIENEDWPDPLDKEERWCKEKHEFVKSKAREDYTCEKEDKEIRKDYSYRCINCGMVQCKKCLGTNANILPDIADDPNGPGQIANEYRTIKATLGEEAKLTEGDTVSSIISEPSEDKKSEVKPSADSSQIQPRTQHEEEKKPEVQRWEDEKQMPRPEPRPMARPAASRSAPGAPNPQDEPSPPSKSQERPSDCGCLTI
eukprot:TRINITY_DN138_c0_g3_i1.p1 TRINITY_DN138_c0_g3~~TRINITY_DN138_c0_g3_i1.p1  ORF type:complete len:879 (+),score=259.64 TRINITY_DN138_c0_g3_i1:50-2638(+)